MTPPDKVFQSAHAWLQQGRFDQALPLFLDALSRYESMKQTAEVVSQVCRCRYLAAKAAVILGRDDEAEILLRDAMRIAPSVPDLTTRAAAYFAFGEFLVEHGRNDEAIAPLQAALSLNDYPANGWRLLGVALDECGKHQDALRSFERALESDPFNPQVLYNLAVCLGYLNRVDDSREKFDQAIDLAEVDDNGFKAQAYNARGGMLVSANRYDEAEKSFLLAIEHDPKHDGAPFNLADLLERRGRDVEALRYWQKAVELDPSDLNAARRLARLRAKLGAK